MGTTLYLKQCLDQLCTRVNRHFRRAARKPTIVCIDKSADLLAYLNALLTHAGYEVFTTPYVNDAKTLVNAIRPRLVIYGTGSQTSEFVIEKIRRSVPTARVMLLPSDFSTAEAGEAGAELVRRVRSILTGQHNSCNRLLPSAGKVEFDVLRS